MDRFNVITPTSDIDELNNDMSSWCSLPYNLRLRSDEECIRRYNITNIDLYNRLKAAIIANKLPENPELIGNAISEGLVMSNDNLLPEFDFLNDEEQNFIWKKQTAEQLELSPNIVIISPFKGNEKEYSIGELEDKFNKYNLLTPKNKRFSNSYSINIWGYDVPNMYSIMKKKILSIDGLDGDIIATLGESKYEKVINPVIESMNEKIVRDDKIGLLQIKLDSCSEMTAYPKAIYESMNKEINKTIYEKDFTSIISKAVPFFTIDEMNEFGLYYNEASNIKPEDYYKIISEKMNQLELSSGEERDKLTEEVISLGWNPSVKITESNLKFARDRQCKWLKEKALTIVDISSLNSDNIVCESSQSMRSVYKKNNLYPVYIVLSFTNTLFGKAIRAIKHSTYTHAGLSLDSDLRNITTFKFGSEWNGFTTESINNYINTFDDALIDVLCIFVDKNTKEKIELVIRDFISKQEKTRYGFGNLFNILINRAKDDPENLSLVCSQFVDTVLKLCNIDITKKPSNLVIPQDFSQISNNPNIYKLYEGLAKNYNERHIENNINMLFKTTNTSDVKYSNDINFATEYYIQQYKPISGKAIDVVNEINYFLTPESIIVEKKFPININDKGDLIIKLYKSLEDEYQEAHRLLKQYGSENIEGIKHELARLFYVNSTIEKKIKKMDKEDENYKKFINLRARVLNDFKKYFKIVIEKEPNFNFSEYFQKSEYYNGNIVIDNSILKYTGSLIKKFLQSLGL